MKLYILVLVVLFSLAAPAMAAELNATQISYTEMWVNGTGFVGANVTLSTMTNISVTPSPSGTYSYEITEMYLPAGSVLTLDASPVKDDLELYVKKYWLLAWTFKNGSVGIYYSYNDTTDTVHVHRSIPLLVAGTFQTIRVYGTTENSSVNLSVVVKQPGVAVSGGNFSKTVNINAIPAGNYTISATDGTNTATANITILAKPAPTPSGGGGGDGTYPPGWFGTPTPTPAVTPTATPSSGVTPAPAGGGVTPAPAKPAEAGKTPTAPAGEGPTKKDIPGFTAVLAIAGLLAIAYVVMRQRR